MSWIISLGFCYNTSIYGQQGDLIEQNSSRKPVNESYLRVYFMGRFHSKVIYQKCAFFTNIENDYLLKVTRKK